LTGKKKLIGLFSSVYLLSHVILDIFNGGITLLYPLYDRIFEIQTEVVMSKSHEITYLFNFGNKHDIIGNYSSHIISSDGVGILTLALILLLLRRYSKDFYSKE
jgi:hypothetical protein